MMGPVPRLNVVTAVSRPDNLRFLQRHLAERLPSFDVRWYCVADTNHVTERPAGLSCTFWGECAEVGCAGGARKNVALDAIEEGWVCFLDDDNTIHPRLDSALRRAISAQPDAVGHVFGQVDVSGNVVRKAGREHVHHGGIDVGQFVVRRDAIGDSRFPANVYASDWALFEKLWRRHADRWTFNEPAVFYNALADRPREFTDDWLAHNLAMFEEHLLPSIGSGALGLEVGCYEGRATCWFLEHLPDSRIVCVDTFSGAPEVHPDIPAERYDAKGSLIGLEERFLRNVRAFRDRVRLCKEASCRALRRLPFASFDFAYIDGSHRAPDVLEDLVLSLRLLKRGGVLFADDYLWTLSLGELQRPKIAIDAFLQIFAQHIEVLSIGYSVVIRRR